MCNNTNPLIVVIHPFRMASSPDDKLQRYLGYLRYWTLNLRPLIIYPYILFPPNFIIKGK